MAKLSDDEARQLAELEARRDAPDEPDEIVEVVVERGDRRYHLKGDQAKKALEQLFDAQTGDGTPGPKKVAPKKVAPKKVTPPPAGDGAGEDGDQGDGAGEDGDQGDELDSQEETDEGHQPPHWYFGKS